MKRQSLKALVIYLRICITVLVLSLLSLFLFSFVSATKIGDEIWKQIGINKQQGTEGIYRSFTGGYLYYYEARNVKNIALGNRVAIAKDLLEYTKQYINSDAFKKAYEKERTQAMPVAPVAKQLHTKAEIQKIEIEKVEKSIADSEKSMKGFDGDMKKSMQAVVDMFKGMLKDYQNPNHQYFDALLLNEKYEKEQNEQRYVDDMEKWKDNYPADFTPIIKQRLTKFLDVTKDVDFNAELKLEYNKKKFVNAVYERKPTEWKQAFRAGKEITGYARSFAEQWLNELK